MLYSRWSVYLSRFGFKLGLLLVVVGVLFGLATRWVSDRVLSQPSTTLDKLVAQGQYQVELSLQLTVLSIDAAIDRTHNIAEVNVRTMGSALEEMEFKFPTTEFAGVEKAIAQELGLSPNDIRKLIRYRLD